MLANPHPKDYDAHGDYLKHWLPELKDVPAPLLFEPWKLSPSQQAQYNVKIGEDYPRPMNRPGAWNGGGGGGGGGGGRGGKERKERDGSQKPPRGYQHGSMQGGGGAGGQGKSKSKRDDRDRDHKQNRRNKSRLQNSYMADE